MSRPESEDDHSSDTPRERADEDERTDPTGIEQSTQAELSASGRTEDTSHLANRIKRWLEMLLNSHQRTRQRLKSAILWGSIGALIFLISVQAYSLVGGEIPTGYARLLAVAAVIGGIVAFVTYTTEYRLIPKGRT